MPLPRFIKPKIRIASNIGLKVVELSGAGFTTQEIALYLRKPITVIKELVDMALALGVISQTTEKKKLKDMTKEERREYQREAARRSRLKYK